MGDTGESSRLWRRNLGLALVNGVQYWFLFHDCLRTLLLLLLERGSSLRRSRGVNQRLLHRGKTMLDLTHGSKWSNRRRNRMRVMQLGE